MEHDPRQLWKAFVRRVGAVLALAGTTVFVYNLLADRDQIQEVALKRARAHFRDILLTWHWNSDYGGVYVEKKPGVESNSFLEFPDFASTDGKTYTLRDPDTMSREIAALARREGEHQFHITSLRPKNPENYPDPWEEQALRAFEAGKPEAFGTTRDGGKSVFRYMAPMQTEKACLTCHSDKVYKIGRVHGGISVSFDISESVAANRNKQAMMALMILLSMGGVFFATRLFTRRLDQRLTQINDGYREMAAEKNAILQNAVVGIAFVRDRHIVSCNRRFEEIFGAGPDELTGKSTRALYASDDIYESVGQRAYADLAQGRKFGEEVLLRHQQGHTFWGAMTGQAIDPEHPEKGAIWIYADITVRRAATEEANKLRRAVEQSPVSILIANRNGEIEYVNPRFSQVTGYSRQEVVGRNPRLLNSGRMPRELFVNMWNTLLTGREWRGQLLNKRKTGELFWEDVSISPIVAETGEISHFIAVKEDITERKQAEMRQEEHQAELEELVQQRTADLSCALDAARAADRAKNEFLANMSHEMRTPLNAVIGLSGLAMNTVADPRQKDYLEKIGHAGQTLLDIINDLLDLSKIAAGRLEMEDIPFSLAELMDRVASLVSHRLAEKKLGFQVHIAPELPTHLLGDPLRLEQILLNLLTNAIKFTPHGSVVVRFRQEAWEDNRVRLLIEVADTGIGLSEAEIDRLFQPFSQADTSITRTHGGTGLGLTICRRLAEMMGGAIGVSSAPGIGSTFRVQVTLGIADPAALADLPAHDIDVGDIRYRNSRVLVVDDQPINRQIVMELLKQVGIEGEEADNGRTALAAIQARPADWFDLVFMDVQMPEMDGHTASRAIRALPSRESLPIVAMTAHAMVHERQASLAAGMSDHLGKPFSTETFYRLLAQWIPAGRQYRGQATARPSPTARGALPAIAGVDTQAGLHRFAGNQSAYLGWLRKFQDEGDSPLAAVVSHLEAGRREEGLKTLHAFKGRVGMLGLTALWEAVVALESALKEGRDDALFLAAARRQLADTQKLLAEALPAPAETAP